MKLLRADRPNPIEYEINELFKVWDKKLILIADNLFPPNLLPMIKHVLPSFGITLELFYLLFHLRIISSTWLLAHHQELKDELNKVQKEAKDEVRGLQLLQPLWVSVLFLLVLIDELLMSEVKVEVPDLILDESMRGQRQVSDKI